MISCNLQGGLGNQMFQISAAASLALSNNDTFSFNFNSCSTPNQGFTSSKYTGNIFKNIPHHDSYSFENFYYEPFFSYSEIRYNKNLLLNGYFQSEKYFIENSDFIKNLFFIDPTNINFLKNKYDFGNITCVHIRRGDYVKFKNFHLACDVDYYKKSIEIIGNGKFLFISDDIDWVKSNFISENFLFSEFNDEILDFTCMTLCKNLIISNSSFSWWGGYLNKNVKKIISPKRWFAENGPKDYQDVIPKNWILVDN